MYKVISYTPLIMNGVQQNREERHESDGFSSRETAERFAIGLAASGKCTHADVVECDDD